MSSETSQLNQCPGRLASMDSLHGLACQLHARHGGVHQAHDSNGRRVTWPDSRCFAASSSSSAADSSAQPSGGTLSEGESRTVRDETYWVERAQRLSTAMQECIARDMSPALSEMHSIVATLNHFAWYSHPGEQAAPRAFCGSVMRDTTPVGLFVCRLESGHSGPHRATTPDGAGDAMWTEMGEDEARIKTLNRFTSAARRAFNKRDWDILGAAIRDLNEVNRAYAAEHPSDVKLVRSTIPAGHPGEESGPPSECAQCGDDGPLHPCPTCGNDLCSACAADPCDRASSSGADAEAPDDDDRPNAAMTRRATAKGIEALVHRPAPSSAGDATWNAAIEKAASVCESRAYWLMHGEQIFPANEAGKCARAIRRHLRAAPTGAAATVEARPESEWNEDNGSVLWWKFPIVEPPYVGSPLDDDFPDYVTHWTPIVVPAAPTGATESAE